MTISAYPGRLLWHHDAHTQWGQSSLKLWFLSFRHSYDPDEVLPALHDVAIENGLYAYASYELLGPFDVLLRMYIPSGIEQSLVDAVEARLQRHDLKGIDRFKASEVVRHWPWAKNESGSGPLRNPTKTTMKRRRPTREIAIINKIGHLAELPETVDLSPTNKDLLNTYVSDKLVTFATRNQGIRMITRVSHPDNLDREALDNLTRQLARALDEASSLVGECSLYRGQAGQQPLFLLMYRVSFEQFHTVRRAFLQKIREIVGSVNASTMTSVIISDDVKCFADSLPEDLDESPPRDYLELIAADESQDFEVKGSAFAKLGPWLYDDKALQESDDFFRETILKTICGFLNSRGGILVVGALETKHLGTATKELGDYPKIGPHTFVGLLDPSYARGWDAYLRHCSAAISKGIEPSPGMLVQIIKERHEEADLMVITVDEPDDEQEYYVPESQKNATFYARVDNSTVPLRGVEIKRHMGQVIQRRRRRRARSAT